MFKIHRHRKFVNGQTVDYDLYFSLNKYEIFELSDYYDGELTERINKIILDKDIKGLVTLLKQIVILSYGEFHDGDYSMFYKFDINAVPLAEKFMQSDDFGDVLMELLTNKYAIDDFMRNVVDHEVVTDSSERDRVCERMNDIIQYISHCSDNITRILKDIESE